MLFTSPFLGNGVRASEETGSVSIYNDSLNVLTFHENYCISPDKVLNF